LETLLYVIIIVSFPYEIKGSRDKTVPWGGVDFSVIEAIFLEKFVA